MATCASRAPLLGALWGDTSSRWTVVIRDDAGVLARLAAGQCDGLLADCWLEPDDLLHFALEAGAFPLMETLPDRRTRRSIPAALFGRVLLAGTLPDRRSLRAIGATVFNSAVLLDQLGVNFFHTRDGGPRTGDERPFDVEALGDFLALLTREDYATHGQDLARWLRRQPVLAGDVWALDCVDVRIPRGRVGQRERAQVHHVKVAVLSVVTPHGALPLLWRFGTPAEGDTTLARALWDDVEALWGKGACATLLVDAGFLDGPWMAARHAEGTVVVTRLREDMDPCVAADAWLATQPAVAWAPAALPQRPADKVSPRRREIASLPEWPGWAPYGRDLALCVVRDTYADDKTDTWYLMSTDPTQAADAIYPTFRRRWHLEETFMALARYHHLNALPGSRPGVAMGRLHVLFFAYSLRAICRAAARDAAEAAGGRPWRRTTPRYVAYSGGAFALLRPSQVVEVVVRHADVWAARLDHILAAVRYCEGSD